MRFAPGELPDVKAFWSITMYDTAFNLVANPINRYAIGNRTPNLKEDADGGLTLYIQGQSPGKDKEDNWLLAMNLDTSTPTGKLMVNLLRRAGRNGPPHKGAAGDRAHSSWRHRLAKFMASKEIAR